MQISSDIVDFQLKSRFFPTPFQFKNVQKIKKSWKLDKITFKLIFKREKFPYKYRHIPETGNFFTPLPPS